MFKKFFVLFNIFAILVPSVIFADGMMIAPPNRYIFETDQKAVIFFEDGMETLIISASFKGDAGDFGWIIPTPSRPEVEKASKEIFTALRELTEVQRDYPRATGLGSDLMSEKSANSVHVLEEKKIEYYDIAVLAADNKDALADWLNKNGYHFPKQYSYILDSYIQNKWFFTAVKISKDVAVKNLQQDMWSGSLIPLQFKFLTNRPVYPLKISSIIEEQVAKSELFVKGKINNAISLKKEEKLHTVINALNLDEGTIEMWFKVDKKNSYKTKIPFVASYDSSNSKEKLYFSGVEDGLLSLRLYNLEENNYRYYSTIENVNLVDVWNYIVVSWKKGEDAKFYFNGELLKSGNSFTPAVGHSPYAKYKADSKRDRIYFGQGNTGLKNYDVYIDETRISSKMRSGEEIKEGYNAGLGKNFSFNKDTRLLASFEKLIYLDGMGSVGSFAHSKKAIPVKINYHKPSQIGIELYIFTKDKEQILPGFQTKYAAWTDKKVIEDLAFNDNGEQWIKVKNDKYYLTKLSRYMKYSEMDNDLFFRDAEKNSDIIVDTQKSKTFFYVIITLSILFLFILLPILIYQFYKKD